MSRDGGWSNLDVARIPGTLSWDPALLASLSGADVLDLGCGPAPSFAGLEHFGGRRIGVDGNAEALDAARRALPEASFVQADAKSLPFPAGSFDLVLCKALLTALVHDQACEAALLEASRVLRSPGALLVADFLVNEEDTYFADRYRAGERAGLPPGAFEVRDDEGNVLYVARHFAPDWIGRWAKRAPAVELERIEERQVRTRSGRATRGFLALLRT